MTHRTGHQAAADALAQIMLARTGQHGYGTVDPPAERQDSAPPTARDTDADPETTATPDR